MFNRVFISVLVSAIFFSTSAHAFLDLIENIVAKKVHQKISKHVEEKISGLVPGPDELLSLMVPVRLSKPGKAPVLSMKVKAEGNFKYKNSTQSQADEFFKGIADRKWKKGMIAFSAKIPGDRQTRMHFLSSAEAGQLLENFQNFFTRQLCVMSVPGAALLLRADKNGWYIAANPLEAGPKYKAMRVLPSEIISSLEAFEKTLNYRLISLWPRDAQGMQQESENQLGKKEARTRMGAFVEGSYLPGMLTQDGETFTKMTEALWEKLPQLDDKRLSGSWIQVNQAEGQHPLFVHFAEKNVGGMGRKKDLDSMEFRVKKPDPAEDDYVAIWVEGAPWFTSYKFSFDDDNLVLVGMGEFVMTRY